MIPKEYSGKYIWLSGGNGYKYDDYFETTSSNFIIHSKTLGAKALVLKNANTNHDNSYNGKAILYYEDKDNPEYYFYFFTNKQSKRTINYGEFVYTWSFNYIHVDDINK